MSQLDHSIKQQQVNSRVKTLWFIVAFLLITVAGLLYVKWWPYYHKAILAADTHSIGSSILGIHPITKFPSGNQLWIMLKSTSNRFGKQLY